VHPYLGAEALEPFLARKDKGVLVLCRTSNPGAGEFQDLDVSGEPLYRAVAKRVSTYWNKNRNCGLVVGATFPRELREVREAVGEMPILIPGIGTQGGDVEATVDAGKDKRGRGMIINASRSIIFASPGTDFVEAARRETKSLRDAINNAADQKGKRHVG
jgi:orotidine-5'-phosphate decarboxylase